VKILLESEAVSMLSELNTLLEKIPVWKELTKLPKRVAELEDKVRMLEQSSTVNIQEDYVRHAGLLWEKDNPLPFCPKCKELMGAFEKIAYICDPCDFQTNDVNPPVID